MIEKEAETQRTKLSKESSNIVRKLPSKSNKEVTFKAFGQLLAEVEKKNLPQRKIKESFKGDLDMKVDNHFLNLLENHPDDLRERLKEILISKLRTVLPRKRPPKTNKKSVLLENNEFIGEDEIISTSHLKPQEYTASNIIKQPKIEYENIENEGLEITDIHSLSHGED